MLTLPLKVKHFFIPWRVLGLSEGRRYIESEGVFKVLTEFSEATEMAVGSRYEVYRDILCSWGLSSMVMGDMQSWANKIICKLIIEAVINRLVIVL